MGAATLEYLVGDCSSNLVGREERPLSFTDLVLEFPNKRCTDPIGMDDSSQNTRCLVYMLQFLIQCYLLLDLPQ